MTAPGTDWWESFFKDAIHNALKTVQSGHFEAHNENLWSAGHLVEDVADSGYMRLLIINNGLKELHLDFEVSVEGKAYLKAFRGGTFSDNGTGVAEVNHVGKSTATTDAEVTYDPTVSGAGTQMHPTELLPGGTGPKTVGGGGDSKDAEYIIPPADNFYVEVQNKGGAVKDCSIEINWYEEDVVIYRGDATTTTSTTTTSSTSSTSSTTTTTTA